MGGGGAFFARFVHVVWERGYVECPRLSTQGGEGVKIGKKMVHVVVECPLTELMSCLSNLRLLMRISPLCKRRLLIGFLMTKKTGHETLCTNGIDEVPL